MFWDIFLFGIVLFSIPIAFLVVQAIQAMPENKSIDEVQHDILVMMDEDEPAEKCYEKCVDLLNVLVEKLENAMDMKNYNNADYGDSIELADRYYVNGQEIAWRCLAKYPLKDEVIVAAFSLITLISKNKEVKERVLTEADLYGLNVPIEIARSSLNCSKNKPSMDRNQELLAAEVQRKAAILLGSFSDNDSNFAKLAVNEGALEMIFDAANFYRMHHSTLKWLLWALFTICYDNLHNKAHLIRISGLAKICVMMKTMVKNIDAQRHGLALLFDCLRNTGEQESYKINILKIRSMAINAGLHDIVVKSMEFHSNGSPEIAMMGREILIGTGYEGVIPEYNGPSTTSLVYKDQ